MRGHDGKRLSETFPKKIRVGTDLPDRRRHPAPIFGEIEARIGWREDVEGHLLETLEIVTGQISREECPGIFQVDDEPRVSHASHRWVGLVRPANKSAGDLLVRSPGQRS